MGQHAPARFTTWTVDACLADLPVGNASPDAAAPVGYGQKMLVSGRTVCYDLMNIAAFEAAPCADGTRAALALETRLVPAAEQRPAAGN